MSKRVMMALISLGIVAVMPAWAQGDEGGWIRLFDGKRLDGWRANENASTFSVREGMIVASGTRSHLFYAGAVGDHDFKNFEFKADVKTEPGANSGIYFHTRYQESDWPKKGYEAQINNTHLGTGEYRELKRTGSLYAVRNVFTSPVADNTWFTMRIKVVGRQVRIWVDDFLLVDYTEPDHPVRKAEYADTVLSHGTFALQGHDPDSTVYFRNIYVKLLPDGPKTADRRGPDEIAYQRDISALQGEFLPLVDFHVHLKGGLTLEEALAKSREAGIGYGIAQNCGVGFPVTDDAGLKRYLESLEGQPVFKGIQAEGREWVGLFSEAMLAKFDYIFTDSMTFTDDRGRRTRLWMPDEVWVEDKQAFMDMLVEKTVTILTEEPVDIYVNPTFLPASIADEYDALWTNERMDRVIAAAVKNDVAIEINSRFRLPSETFLKRAKQAGAKFSFGTNNGGKDLGRLEYSRSVAKRLGLKKADMFMPKPEGQKAIQRKGLPRRSR
jgi:3-keto-disaccharide hydrolase